MSEKVEKSVKAVVSALEAIGFEISYKSEQMPIRQILRASWYVDRLIELGYESCVYISFDGSTFFAVLDNGDIATGANCMLSDAWQIIALDTGWDCSTCIGNKGVTIYEEDDDMLIITTLEAFNENIKQAL